MRGRVPAGRIWTAVSSAVTDEERLRTICGRFAGSIKLSPARCDLAEQLRPSVILTSPLITVIMVIPAWVCHPLCPPGTTVSRSTPTSELSLVLRNKSHLSVFAAFTSTVANRPSDTGEGVKPDPGVASAGITINAEAPTPTNAAMPQRSLRLREATMTLGRSIIFGPFQCMSAPQQSAD